MFQTIQNLYSREDYTFWYKLQLISLLLVALTMPFSIPLNNLAIGLLALSWLLSGNLLEKLRRAFTNKLFLLFFGVFLMQVVGLLYTSNIQEGLVRLEAKAALAIIPLILASSDKLNRQHVHLILVAFIVACLLMTSRSLYWVLSGYGDLGNDIGLTEFIDEAIDLHHAYSGMYLVFAVAASLYLAAAADFKRGWRVVIVIVAVFLYAFLIMLAARTAVFISFFLFFLFMGYVLIVNKKKKYLVAAAVASVAVLLIVISLPNTKRKIEDFNRLKGVHSPITPRLIKWKCCFIVLNQQYAWVAGVGTGDVQDYLQQCYTDEKFWGERYLLNAHNEFLEETVRHGLLGGLLFLASLLYPLWLAVRRKHVIYTIFLVVFMISCLTESTLSRQKGVVFYSLFNAVFAFSSMRGNSSEELTIEEVNARTRHA
ncbi:O-antigen ligase family protein [Pontibacter roseus]|uniref:O-antigen ligase family protein n=1 Tax=Pontibacter roseus TaxID=336989 RepID=UPI00036FB095|nr:O-antigen ligase family protein [Pontibacter roseus]